MEELRQTRHTERTAATRPIAEGAWAPQVACKTSCGGTEPHAMGAGHGEKRASSARQGAAPLPPSLQLTQAKLSTPKKTQHQKGFGSGLGNLKVSYSNFRLLFLISLVKVSFLK